ncbi:MBL fold metallo-hydrolase, partial [Streptomyces sp. SID10244]|nr:MBL fold metallo-hydrolase [Streptomyces sp. SID10244]
ADRPMLADPGRGLGRALESVIGTLEFREPEKVIDFVDGEDVDLAGIRISVDLAPGHTQGSVLLGIEVPVDAESGHQGEASPEVIPVCFS